MIDKDIEIVKELVKKQKDIFKRSPHAIAIMPRIEEKDVLAVESVLKEVEELQDDLSIHEETSFEFQEENIKLRKELETWEKIAKRLAKEILSIHSPIFNMVTVKNMEILIENARKEVENGNK